MNRIAGVVRIHTRDKWTWLLIPLSITIGTFLTNFIVASLLDVETAFITGGIGTIFVYFFVIGFIVLPQTYGFSIGLNIRRKDYFLGTAAAVGMISVGFAIILMLLGTLETATDRWGANLYFFHLPYISEGTMLEQLYIYFSVMMFLFFTAFVISSVHRRFGIIGLFGLLSVLIIVFFGSFVMAINQWWIDFLYFKWVLDYTMFQHSLWMFAGAVIFAGISYVLLRRSTI